MYSITDKSWEENVKESIFKPLEMERSNISIEDMEQAENSALGYLENYKITDYDVIYNLIKENIFLIEQKLNHTFTESILIINNFHFSFINLSGYKKLNGSKIVKDNITYILNSLKSAIDESEKKKKFFTFLIQIITWIKKILKIYQ